MNVLKQLKGRVLMREVFFSDQELWDRDNVIRKYGSHKLVSVYENEKFSTNLSTGFVFKTDDKKYSLIY